MNVNGYDDLRNNCRLSFSGLPPLPQSLNGKELTTLNNTLNHSERTDELERKACSLDSHLASLKRQMVRFYFIIELAHFFCGLWYTLLKNNDT